MYRRSLFTVAIVFVFISVFFSSMLVYGNEPVDPVFGLPLTYKPLIYDTTEERFEAAKAELPKEVPVIQPKEIQGNIEIFVSPKGADNNPGTKDKPLATLKAAFGMLNKVDRTKGVVIYLREGSYNIPATIDITGLNSGTEDAPVFVSSYDGEHVQMSSAEVISHDLFEKAINSNNEIVKKNILRIKESDREKIYVADLKEAGINGLKPLSENSLYSVYQSGYAKQLARWPNTGMGITMKTVIDRGDYTNSAGDTEGRGFEFEYSDNRVEKWENDGNLWMHGAFNKEWIKRNVQIKEIKPETSSIVTVTPPYNELATARSDCHHYYYNVFEELDATNEFYIDADNLLLYIFSTESVKDDCFIMAGKYSIFRFLSAEHMVFNGIEFSNSGKVADLVRCHDILFQNCKFKNLSNGFTFGGSKFCGIINSDFSFISDSAVALDYFANDAGLTDGYLNTEKQSMEPRRNFIQNCIFSGSDGFKTQVVMGSIGNIISHNLFENSQFSSIQYSLYAGEEIIEYNEFCGYSRTEADAGGIYCASTRDNAYNHIRYNYFHHPVLDLNIKGTAVMGPSAIYFDEMSSDQFVYGNIMVGAHSGVAINSGSRNAIVNNIYAYPGGGLTIPWNFGSPKFRSDLLTNDVMMWTLKHGWSERYQYMSILDYKGMQFASRFPQVSEQARATEKVFPIYEQNSTLSALDREATETILNAGEHVMTKNLVVGLRLTTEMNSNLYYESADYYGVVHEGNFVCQGDPGFVNKGDTVIKTGEPLPTPERDYNLKSDSIVFEKIDGFEAPPFDKMGLTREKVELDPVSGLYPMDGSTAMAPEYLELSWNDIAGASYYRVFVAKDPNFTDIVAFSEGIYPKFTVDILEKGTTYYWKVEPVTLAKSRVWKDYTSQVQSFTTMTDAEIKELHTSDWTLFDTKLQNFIDLYNDLSFGNEPGQISLAHKGNFEIMIEEAQKFRTSGGALNYAINSMISKIENVEIEAKKSVNPGFKEITDYYGSLVCDEIPNGLDCIRREGNELIFDATEFEGSYGTFTTENMHHRTNIHKCKVLLEDFTSWWGFSMQNTHGAAHLSKTGTYFFILKPDLIELQKYETGYTAPKSNNIVVDVVNNGEFFKTNTWHDVEVGFIPCAEGVRCTLVIDGKTVIDYMDTDKPIYKDGHFGMMISKSNGDARFIIPDDASVNLDEQKD